MQNIGLVWINGEAFSQKIQRFIELFPVLQNASQVVDRQQHHRFIFWRRKGDVLLNPAPLGNCLVKLAHPLKQQAKVQSWLKECRRQLDRLSIGRFSAGQIALIGQHRTKVKIGSMRIGRLSPAQPCLIKHRRQGAELIRFKLAGTINQL